MQTPFNTFKNLQRMLLVYVYNCCWGNLAFAELSFSNHCLSPSFELQCRVRWSWHALRAKKGRFRSSDSQTVRCAKRLLIFWSAMTLHTGRYTRILQQKSVTSGLGLKSKTLGQFSTCGVIPVWRLLSKQLTATHRERENKSTMSWHSINIFFPGCK